MEKIKLNDGTTLDIQGGSAEYAISLVAESVDATVALFTDANLEKYEILTEKNDVCAIYSKKHLKNFKAEVVEDGYLITVTLVDRDELYERVAQLEAMLLSLTQETPEEVTEEITESEDPAE